jgi:hypothetical protein
VFHYYIYIFLSNVLFLFDDSLYLSGYIITLQVSFASFIVTFCVSHSLCFIITFTSFLVTFCFCLMTVYIFQVTLSPYMFHLHLSLLRFVSLIVCVSLLHLHLSNVLFLFDDSLYLSGYIITLQVSFASFIVTFCVSHSLCFIITFTS